ncbi:hypothetical protein INT47_012915 [Mucor saturninus]|uniref:Uncharacterized protein n=1 Tax=Mucor saturninus TaxID=64648 RepID=A0A8H7QNS6_9FUNG|nr:hypothetical protein INT47_012915 [Mucor saturninus]
MFTKLFNTIRDTLSRETVDNNNKKEREQASVARRPSITEELQNNDTHSVFSDHAPSSAKMLGRNNSISVSEPISINDSAAGGKPQRGATLFGISKDTADDFVQKDLISSSWS